MATYNSDVYAAQDNTAFQGNGSKLGTGNLGGRVRHIYFEVTSLVAVLGTSDFINLCKLPAGARVVDYKISIPDMGTTGVLKIGHTASSDAVESADDDSFGGSITVTSAVLHTPAFAHAALLKKFASEVTVQIVPTTATDAGNVTVKGMIAYVID
jgi:hypothetical protein